MIRIVTTLAACTVLAGVAHAQQQPTTDQQPAATIVPTQTQSSEPQDQASGQQEPSPVPVEIQASETSSGQAGGTAQQLTDAQNRLQQLAQDLQQADKQSAPQIQQQAAQALDDLEQAVRQIQGSPEGQQAQDQVSSLQRQISDARAQLKQDPQQAAQSLEQLANDAGEMAAIQQQAEMPADADAVVGKPLMSSGGDEVGDVSDVLVTGEGKVQALLVDSGGALGMGGRQVAVQWAQIQVQGDQLTVNMSQEQIEQLPEYKPE
jgi:sporulation protein YlmC with PRC-barrel domain